jgi:murein DD-endopeptidase MepM/ murein hydrolase activator NlpD
MGGFAAGALAVSVIVWHFGNVIGSADARARYPAAPPAPLDRWGTDLNSGNIHDPVTATTGTSDAAAGAINPSIGADPLSVLRDRNLLVPVPGVERKTLRGSFSEKRGSSRMHEAIDILAPRHTPVRAVEDGRVARLFFSRDGGITVYQFDPSEQYVYYYAHLERYAANLREGDTVKRGQVIGYVGTSGNAPPGTPHLHFAIFKMTDAKRWWEGAPLDPYQVLK